MEPLDQRVASAIAIMDQQRSQPVSVEELARAVNLSPSYLTRLFHRYVGCAPAHFDRARRLERAYELITSSFLSVKEVMADVGWNDPSHFSRDFRRRFGFSPRALRANHFAESRATAQDADRPSKTPIRPHESAATSGRRNKT